MSEKDFKEMYEGVSKAYRFILHSKSTVNRFRFFVSHIDNQKLSKLIEEANEVLKDNTQSQIPEELLQTVKLNLGVLNELKKLKDTA